MTPLALCLLCAADWQRLPPLPDAEGFAGTFAGVSGGALLVAGGANFPGKKPWEGGSKVWHDAVWVLDRPDGAWKAAGKLPRPLAYGVCVTHRDAVVCVGGGDAARNSADAFRLVWRGGKLVVARLPALPCPLANACGTLLGDTLYVVGGQEAPDSKSASTAAYALDLTALKWRTIAPCPGGGRMLAAAASFGGTVYVAGGVGLVDGERRYRADAYRYDPGKGWKRVADLPHPSTAPPSPCPADADGFFVLGGDDGSQLGVAPAKHRGFRKTLLHYDATADRWKEAGELPAPRVTTPFVLWDGKWVVPSGEVRPGVRTPEVWAR